MNQFLVPLVGIGLYAAWRWIHARRIRSTVARLLAQGATVIDVRSAAEFCRGHVEHSLNIPLGEIERAPLPADPSRWLIVCCASGARSAIAARILRQRGFARVINGVSWANVARCRVA